MNNRTKPLLVASGIAAAAFAGVATASATRKSAHLDRKLAPRIAFRSPRARKWARRTSPAAKWFVLAPATTAFGLALAATDKNRRVGGKAIIISALAATAFGKLCDEMLPQPPVPSGHRDTPRRPVFPSGHSFLSTSVSATTAWVLCREDLVEPAVGIPIAVAFPLFNAWMKLGARKHWPSDALGGILGGVAVAGLCCAAYEAEASRRHTPELLLDG